jgi:O-antigen/teichoic acid export membrane protein
MRTRRVFVWAFIGQVFSSASNFSLAVMAGRLVGPAGLGVVVIGYAAYQLAAGLARAVVLQPLVADASPLPSQERSIVSRAGATLTATTGTAVMIVMAAVGATVPGTVGKALLIFAPWVLVGLLQEFWKTILFQEGRGAAGAATDLVRFATMLVALPLALGRHSDALVVLVWGLGSAVGLLVAVATLRLIPMSLRRATKVWWGRGWHLGRWLGTREVLYQTFTYATVLVLAYIIGRKDLGGLRSAEALFSPFSLIAAALVLPALPALSRAKSPYDARRLAFRITAFAVAFALSYLVVMGLIGPSLLVRLFGGAFATFTGLVWPMGVAQVFQAAGSPFTILLAAEKRGRDTFVAGLVGAAATLGSAVGMADAFGVSGAAWGMAIGAAISTGTVMYIGWAPAKR